MEAARRVAELGPPELRRTFFTSSGTEGIEAAVLLARAVTGRSEIVALRGGYHGRSALGMGLTAHGAYRPLPAPASGVVHARAPYPYRCPFRRPCDETCVDRLVEAFLCEKQSGKTEGRFVAEFLVCRRLSESKDRLRRTILRLIVVPESQMKTAVLRESFGIGFTRLREFVGGPFVEPCGHECCVQTVRLVGIKIAAEMLAQCLAVSVRHRPFALL